MQVPGTQQHLIPNLMLLFPVMLIEVSLLVGLSTCHVLLGLSYKSLDTRDKVLGFHIPFSCPNNNIQGGLKLLPINQLSRCPTSTLSLRGVDCKLNISQQGAPLTVRERPFS